ncbi:ABC transporter ATP-binding protein [bacterium]|nr:ABC transporter ATP-binding protein [bacterium]
MLLSNITKKYGDLTVFDDFSIDFVEGEVCGILGASGCGKTTLLNIIAGITDYQGKIDTKYKTSYIFQSTRLLDNLTVFKNLEYVLSGSGLSKEEVSCKIELMLKSVSLWEERNKYPRQLSGGMRQRVSLARAFIYDAPVLLMDEPFKGLDISLKKQIVSLFNRLLQTYKKTTIFVTHDLDDAIALCDRIIVLGIGGKIIIDETVKHSDRQELYNKIFEVL